jgi:NAD(P)-dependent dehydrogenase (short-subunit alcohol dehydrogenase family)
MAPDPRRILSRLPLQVPARALNDFLNRPTGIRRVPGFLDPRPDPKLDDVARGRVVVITGASSGIGEAAAVRIGAAGAETVLIARREDELQRVADEISAAGGFAYVHPCDLSDPESIERTTAAILDQHGRVDVLINNAGRSIRRSVKRSIDRPHDYERTMQLNYFGAVRLILAFLPGMREQQWGHIINISTSGTSVKPPRFSGYLASKAALETFSTCIAAELADEGIRFTNVQMPLVRTPMIEPSGVYRGMRALSPELAAERIVQAMIHRPRNIGTPISDFAEFADSISQSPMAAARAAGYRMTKDSNAARTNGK